MRVATAAAAVAVVAAAVMVISAGGDGGPSDTVAEATTTSTVPEDTTTTSVITSGPPASGPVETGDPAPPWRSAALPRDDLADEVIEAWERAENRDRCRLLLPADLGSKMDGATSGASPVSGDAGWEITFRKGPAVVQVQGLFEASTRSTRTEKEIFSRRWSDGSVVRYGPDARNEEQSPEDVDPETTANEATLILPDQGCAYVLYDTLGKTHLEFVLDHLRFVSGTE